MMHKKWNWKKRLKNVQLKWFWNFLVTYFKGYCVWYQEIQEDIEDEIETEKVTKLNA